ncbi:hypothetical protein C8R44DRAFT_725508 [Mycena epipterygia]|nr:hypothetical protein C8R44DRAFT_725508 [Mycena epipterygia]
MQPVPSRNSSAPVPSDANDVNLAVKVTQPDEHVHTLPAPPMPFSIVNPLQVLSMPATASSATAPAEVVPSAADVSPIVPVVVPAAITPMGRRQCPDHLQRQGTCLIDWCKKHPGGFCSAFKTYWDSIENTAEAQQWIDASASAAAAKTKLECPDPRLFLGRWLASAGGGIVMAGVHK